jgi:hypothetical protein
MKKLRKESTLETTFSPLDFLLFSKLFWLFEFEEELAGGKNTFPVWLNWYLRLGLAILSFRAVSESPNFSNFRLNFRPSVDTPRTREGL